MEHLSPRTKCQYRQIKGYKKGTGRVKSMVLTELVKNHEPPAVKRTPSKVSSEIRCPSTASFRPLKRPRAEDHIFGHQASPDVSIRRSVKQGLEPVDGSERFGHHSMARYDQESRKRFLPTELRGHSPDTSLSPERITDERRATTVKKSLSPCFAPSPKKSPSPCSPSPSGAQSSLKSNSPCWDSPNRQATPSGTYARVNHHAQFRVVEESPTINGTKSDSSSAVSSSRKQVERRTCSPQATGCLELLRRVESPETFSNAPAGSPRQLSYGYIGESDHVNRKAGLQDAQRRARSPEDLTPNYFHGLWNLGNTCYMNAVIQLLYSLHCFAADLHLPVLDVLLSHDGIYQALRLVFDELDKAPVHAAVNPAALKDACEKHMTEFCGSVQQDAQEFLCNVLDKIEEEVTSFQSENEGSRASETSNKSICPTTRNFSCQVRNTLSCERCGNSVKVEQSCRHFSLPLPQDRRDPQAEVPDIEALLDLYFQIETVARKCERCGAETMRSETKILQVPRVVVLHINRFEIDHHLLCSKVSVPVKFDDALDLGKWCLEEVRGPCNTDSRVNCGQETCPGCPEDSAGCVGTLYVGGPVNGRIDGAVDGRSVDGAADGRRSVDGAAEGWRSVDGAADGRRSVDGAAEGWRSVDGAAEGRRSVDGAADGRRSVDGAAEGRRSVDGAADGRRAVDGAAEGKRHVDGSVGEQRDVERYVYRTVDGAIDEERHVDRTVDGAIDEERHVDRTVDGAIDEERHVDRTVDAKRRVEDKTSAAREQVGRSGVEVDDTNCSMKERMGYSTKYKLHGVVSHVGKLASCGHYIVDIYDSRSQKWVRCDDYNVGEVAPEDVFGEEKAGEAYVLLYVLSQ